MARRLCLLPKSLSNQLMLLRNINDKKSAARLSLAAASPCCSTHAPSARGISGSGLFIYIP